MDQPNVPQPNEANLLGGAIVGLFGSDYFSGLVDTIFVRTLLLAAIVDNSKTRLYVIFLFHGIRSWSSVAQRSFFVALRRLLSRDGADDENITTLILSGGSIFIYIVALIACHNYSLAWQVLKTTAVPVIKMSLVLLVFLYSMHFTMLLRGRTERRFQESIAGVLGSISKTIAFVSKPVRLLSALILPTLVILLRRPLHMGIALYKRTEAHFEKTSRLADSALPGEVRIRYTYKPLQGDREMRLLRVSIPRPFAAIQCEIIHVPIGSTDTYEAISYTWGSPKLCCNILIGKKRQILGVTATVYETIRARASFWQPRLLWIDQICIHQDDNEEKSVCVGLMREIFRNANQVTVWLGSPPEASVAMGYLARIRRKMNSNLSDIERKYILELGTKHPGWPALFKLLCHPFWSRIWIIQEIAVARRIIVTYGGEYVTWEYFSGIISALYEPSLGSKFVFTKLDNLPQALPVQEFHRILNIIHYRKIIQENSSVALLDILIDCRKSKATNARDKIYGLLGLCPSAKDPILTVDYEKSIVDVYSEFAKSCLSQPNPYHVLHLAGIGYQRDSELASLPSWAPDWSTPVLATVLWGHDSECCYISSREAGIPVTIPNCSPIMINGTSFNVIQELGPIVFGDDSNQLTAIPQVAERFMAMVKIGMSREPNMYVNGQAQSEALWRTLMGDQVAGIRPALAIYGEHFSAAKRTYERLLLISRSRGEAFLLDDEIGKPADFLLQRLRDDVVSSGKFFHAAGKYSKGRRVALIAGGHMGLVPPLTEVGDLVCVFHGAQTPFVLRRCDDSLAAQVTDDRDFSLVGECYVHGIMDGETEAKERETEIFVIR